MSLSLKDIFKQISLNKDKVWSGKNSGDELENSFNLLLKKNKFTENRDMTKIETSLLKKIIFDAKEKNLTEIVNNNLDIFQNYTFISQPFGSQSFPDNIIFVNGKIITVESKYSKHKKPVWNNSIPEAFAIYIFGTTDDITFFLGNSQLDASLRNKMKEYSKKIQELNHFFDDIEDSTNIKKNPCGFSPYCRINYSQKKYSKEVSLNYFEKEVSHKNKKEVLEYLNKFKI